MTHADDVLVELGRSLHARRITPGRTGNLSRRVPQGFVISPTGVSLGRLRADELATVDLDGTHVAGPRPSKEWPLHLAWYRRDAQLGAVAHVHLRVGELPLLPYRAPCDDDLAPAPADLRT